MPRTRSSKSVIKQLRGLMKRRRNYLRCLINLDKQLVETSMKVRYEMQFTMEDPDLISYPEDCTEEELQNLSEFEYKLNNVEYK